MLLLLLGLSGTLYSCYKYGMPESEFEIYGKVTDKTGQPIENIRITNQNYSDTLHTNSIGKFHLKFLGYQGTRLKFEDIDGEENGGEFALREIDVRFTDADLVKKGQGKKSDQYSKTIDIVLRGVDDEPSIEYGTPYSTFKP